MCASILWPRWRRMRIAQRSLERFFGRDAHLVDCRLQIHQLRADSVRHSLEAAVDQEFANLVA